MNKAPTFWHNFKSFITQAINQIENVSYQPFFGGFGNAPAHFFLARIAVAAFKGR